MNLCLCLEQIRETCHSSCPPWRQEVLGGCWQRRNKTPFETIPKLKHEADNNQINVACVLLFFVWCFVFVGLLTVLHTQASRRTRHYFWRGPTFSNPVKKNARKFAMLFEFSFVIRFFFKRLQKVGPSLSRERLTNSEPKIMACAPPRLTNALVLEGLLLFDVEVRSPSERSLST